MTPRQELILAAMAAGQANSELSPVQAQKLFFLIERNVGEKLGGYEFSFKPYDYGPFDSSVYADLDFLSLEPNPMIEIVRTGRPRIYRLTEQGDQFGSAKLNALDPEVIDYFCRAKDWVKSLSFQGLVQAIYQAFPEMRANSIFRG